jgi:glutamate/tyrosine decarboxylase-like PLP-dependent enzyme
VSRRGGIRCGGARILRAGHGPSSYGPQCALWDAREFAEQIERTCQLAALFADGLRRAGHEILNEVVLNQVLVSFGPGDMTDRVIKAIQDDGICWCGGTSWQGRQAMRAASARGRRRRPI